MLKSALKIVTVTFLSVLTIMSFFFTLALSSSVAPAPKDQTEYFQRHPEAIGMAEGTLSKEIYLGSELRPTFLKLFKICQTTFIISLLLSAGLFLIFKIRQ